MVLVCHGALMQLGFIDPWLYTGLVFGFRELAEEFGVLYYNQRVGFLLPAIGFHELFGTRLGYLLLRVVMVTGLVVALARVARVFVPSGWARCLAVVAVVHPWMWRSLFWNYVDGMAMVYTAATLACVVSVTASRGAWSIIGWSLASGAALALAGATNLFSLAVAGLVGIWPVGFFLALRWWRDLVMAGFAAAGGFLIVYLGLVVGRHFLVPSQGWQWDVMALTTGKDMASGGGAPWHRDVFGLLGDGWYYLLVPVLVLVLVGVAIWASPREKRLPVSLAGLLLALTVALFAVADFGLKAAVISLFFYFVHLSPVTFLAFAAVVGMVLASGTAVRPATWWVVGLGVLAVAGYVGREWVAGFATSLPPLAVAVALAGALLVVLGARRKIGPVGAAAGLVGVMVVSPLAFYAANDAYLPATREEAMIEFEALELGVELREVVGEGPPEAGKLAFWYSNESFDEAPNFFDAMNGVWLWGFSRLHDWSGEHSAVGMPILLKDEIERLPWFIELAVLAWDREEAEAGVARLLEEGWVEPPEYHEFRRENLSFVMAVVKSPRYAEHVEAVEARRERERLQAERAERKAERLAKKKAREEKRKAAEAEKAAAE
ncbi:MAG: hypothetical protein WA771_02840 [Chthoniobacterales bacterium]